MSADEHDGFWSIFVETTGLRATVGCWFTKESAEQQIETWKRRHTQGIRQDISAEDLAELVARPVSS